MMMTTPVTATTLNKYMYDLNVDGIHIMKQAQKCNACGNLATSSQENWHLKQGTTPIQHILQETHHNRWISPSHSANESLHMIFSRWLKLQCQKPSSSRTLAENVFCAVKTLTEVTISDNTNPSVTWFTSSLYLAEAPIAQTVERKFVKQRSWIWFPSPPFFCFFVFVVVVGWFFVCCESHQELISSYMSEAISVCVTIE